ncbi:MAG: hypothetical protein J6O00_11190 [Clostridiales bacterium]|nr:hypothetical protein [Clostridiales bacterium]
MNNIDIKIVRYDDSNKNVEALKGQYGQIGKKDAIFTVIKNLLVINLLNGAKYDGVKLPECYNGCIQCSNGTVINVKDSTLTCSLPPDVNGFGILVIKKWN